MIRLTRVSPTVYTFNAADGDLTARLALTTVGSPLNGPTCWRWSVNVCGEPIDSGAGSYRDARASMLATLESIRPVFDIGE